MKVCLSFNLQDIKRIKASNLCTDTVYRKTLDMSLLCLRNKICVNNVQKTCRPPEFDDDGLLGVVCHVRPAVKAVRQI